MEWVYLSKTPKKHKKSGKNTKMRVGNKKGKKTAALVSRYQIFKIVTLIEEKEKKKKIRWLLNYPLEGG